MKNICKSTPLNPNVILDEISMSIQMLNDDDKLSIVIMMAKNRMMQIDRKELAVEN